jgi:hypothetical protein
MFFLFLLFVVVNIVDGVSASYVLAGESNPLYLVSNSFWFLIFAKVSVLVVIGLYVYRNIYPSNFMHYLTLLIILLGSVVIALGAYSNIHGMKLMKENPNLVQAMKDMPKEEKTKSFWLFTLFTYYLPIVVCIISFVLYEQSRKYVVVDKQYFDSKPWWKRW